MFGALDKFGASSVAVIRDLNYPTCSNESTFYRANTFGLDFVGIYSVDPNSLTYSLDVSAVLKDLQNMGVESVYVCSYDSLCTEVDRIRQ